MGGARICGGGNVLLGGMVAAIVIVVADVGYCGCCVFFFLGSFGFGRCSGFWCGFFWISMVFFFFWSVPRSRGRKRGKGREREREREIVKKRIKKNI